MRPVVLSQSGSLVAFQAARYDLRLPQLDAYGVGMADLGVTCHSGGGCIFDIHRMRVTAGAGSANLAPVATAHIGNLSVSLLAFAKLANNCFDCDCIGAMTQVTGFVSP